MIFLNLLVDFIIIPSFQHSSFCSVLSVTSVADMK